MRGDLGQQIANRLKMVRRRRVRNTCAPRAFAEREALQAALFDEGAPGPDQGFSQPAMVEMANIRFHPRFCPAPDT